METTGKEYASRDRHLAEVFASAARSAGVGRIIYLGGLGELGDGLSQHLRSRREVEERLDAGGVPVTVLRAAMVIGAGSASFEILRYLVERLPVMITPRWVITESQPVAIDDVLYWLVRCLDVPETIGRTLEIGGPDVVAYRDLMHIMAQESGLRRRLILPVPSPVIRNGPAAPCSVTSGRSSWRRMRRRRSPRSAASAAATGGTPRTSCGGSAGSWTRRWVVRGCAAGGAIPSGSSSGRRWISGGWSGSSGTRRWR